MLWGNQQKACWQGTSLWVVVFWGWVGAESNGEICGSITVRFLHPMDAYYKDLRITCPKNFWFSPYDCPSLIQCYSYILSLDDQDRKLLKRKTDDSKQYEGGPKKLQNLLIKILYIYSHMFKLQSPSEYSSLDAIHLSRPFFHYSKQFLNSSILMPFSACVIFLFHLFHNGKTFPFEDTFHPGKQTKLFKARSGE